jgi:hypothetical protein
MVKIGNIKIALAAREKLKKNLFGRSFKKNL